MNVLFGLELSELLDFVEAIATIVALYFTIKTIRDNTRSSETRFVNEVYDNFQELQLAILDNPDTLKIVANEADANQDDVRKNALASLQINNAYKLYRLHQNKLIPDELWCRFEGDMKDLFGANFIYKRWCKIQTFFPLEFQTYINQCILINHSIQSQNNSNHGTDSHSRYP